MSAFFLNQLHSGMGAGIHKHNGITRYKKLQTPSWKPNILTQQELK